MNPDIEAQLRRLISGKDRVVMPQAEGGFVLAETITAHGCGPWRHILANTPLFRAIVKHRTIDVPVRELFQVMVERRWGDPDAPGGPIDMDTLMQLALERAAGTWPVWRRDFQVALLHAALPLGPALVAAAWLVPAPLLAGPVVFAGCVLTWIGWQGVRTYGGKR